MASIPRRTRYAFALSMAMAGIPASALAQCPGGVCSVGDEASLRAAITSSVSGDTIVFTNNITLTTGDLPAVQKTVITAGPPVAGTLTIDGGGFTLSGNGQF